MKPGELSQLFRPLFTAAAKGLVMTICALGAVSPVWSQIAVPLADSAGGTTCRLISLTAGIPWQHAGGDWKDVDGSPQGSKSFAQAKVGAAGPMFIELNVTGLVRDSIARQRRSVGILLRTLAGGAIALHSRESPRQELRPSLLVKTRNSAPLLVKPEADTALDCSSSTSLGALAFLTIHGGSNVAMSFALPGSLRDVDIASAALQVAPKQTYGSEFTIGVFQLVLPDETVGVPRLGVASRYRNDAGLAEDPAVVLAERFESPFWRLQWGKRLIPSVRLTFATGNPAWLMWGGRWFRGHFERVDSDPQLQFEQLAGKALRVNIPKGEQLGLDLRYYFLDHLGSEPEAIYMRYYLRLADDWAPAEGGKLPGLAGTYGRAGWGDRSTDGWNGWSMRGSFSSTGPRGDPFEGMTAVGSYGYIADSELRDGDVISWPYAGLGLLTKNRWYCVEQYIRLNDPGVSNGELRAWINGHLALEKKTLRYRDTSELKIETAWFDVFHGGTTRAPRDLHLYIDNVVIARSYIGPMAR